MSLSIPQIMAKDYIPHLQAKNNYLEIFEKHNRSYENWLGCELVYVLDQKGITFTQVGVPQRIDFKIGKTDYVELKEYHGDGKPLNPNLLWNPGRPNEIPSAIRKLRALGPGTSKWILVVANPLSKAQWLAQSTLRLKKYPGVTNHIVREIRMNQSVCTITLLKVT